MRHNHGGQHTAHSKCGKTFARHNPTHNHTLMNANKNKSFKELRKGFKISQYGDDDKDGVPNYKDCRPWDKKKQDVNVPSVVELRNQLAWDRYNDNYYSLPIEKQESVWDEADSQHRKLRLKAREEERKMFESYDEVDD